jgi:hypothetical protein
VIVFEWIIAILLGAVLLSQLAKRIGVPYPALLALGGAGLAFIPGAPRIVLEPELALALFLAAVLLDAAYDTSPRDLKDNWLPVTCLVLVAVGLTTAAVATVAHALTGMPWAAAIALGAIVAPPDAAAATAVLRQVRLPHRILKILEGESLLNDASALLIYRGAVIAASTATFSFANAAPTFAISVIGSLILGPILAHLSLRVLDALRRNGDTPTNIIVQFTTFGVWLLADRLGLSGVLTIVSYAITVARQAPASARRACVSHPMLFGRRPFLSSTCRVCPDRPANRSDRRESQARAADRLSWYRGRRSPHGHSRPHCVGDELQRGRTLAHPPVRLSSCAPHDGAHGQGRHHLVVRHARDHDAGDRPGLAKWRWRGSVSFPRSHRLHSLLCRVRNSGHPSSDPAAVAE